MTGDEMEKYWYWLVTVEDMWFDKVRKLMEFFDNPKDVYFANEKTLLEMKVFTDEDIRKLNVSRDMWDLDGNMSKLGEKGIGLTYYGKDNYPEKLKTYSDKPYALFYKGRLPNEEKIVAIVGARSCSTYGKEVSESIAEQLGQYGVSVISGMAKGVDKCAHNGCINGEAPTYAVLGSGVDVCYPMENIDLYTNIQKNGGIISEYPPGAKALPWRFPYRNRIISMLADIVIVVEAKEKSGTFITVDYALAYGKDVFAVPGRVTDTLSVGCNKLIRSGAYPYTGMEDLLLHLGIAKNEKNIKNNFSLEKDFEVVYSCLCLYPVGVEEIVQTTGLNIGKVYEILMKLRVKGMAEEVFNGHYIKKLQ